MTAIHLGEVRPEFAVPGRREDGTVEGEQGWRHALRRTARVVVGGPINVVLSIAGGGKADLFARTGKVSGPAGAQALALVDAATAVRNPWLVFSATRVGIVDSGNGITDTAPEFRWQAAEPDAPRVVVGQRRVVWADGSEFSFRITAEEAHLLRREP